MADTWRTGGATAPAFRSALEAQMQADRDRMAGGLSLFPRDIPLEADPPGTAREIMADRNAALAARYATQAQRQARDLSMMSSAPGFGADAPELAAAAGQRQLVADAMKAIFGAPAAKAPKATPAKPAPAASTPKSAPAKQLGPTKADAARLFGRQRAAPTLGDRMVDYYSKQPFAVLQSAVDMMPKPAAAKAPSGKDTMDNYMLYLMQNLPPAEQLRMLLLASGVDAMALPGGPMAGG